MQGLDQILDCPLRPDQRNSILDGLDPSMIRQELERYCIQRLDFRCFDVNNWAVQFLAHANHRTTVITTNYDVLAERILQSRVHAVHGRANSTCHHCNMMAILREDCECVPTRLVKGPTAPLLKLHGSVAWHVCRNKDCRTCDCLVPSCRCSPATSPSCDCCGSNCRPVLVLPSMQKKYSEFREIRRMWDHAMAALGTCAIFTVFGFSFPASDCLICDVARTAFRSNTRLRKIRIIDVTPDAVADRLTRLLPRDRNIRVEGFEVPRDDSVPKWFA